MKRIILFVIAVIFSIGVIGQNKKWYFENGLVKSVLGKKAPKLVVEEWVSAKPDTTGKFIVLEFWKINCNPCIKHMPHINELSKKFKKEVAFIGLSSDSAEKVRTTNRVKLEIYSAVDQEQHTAKELGLRFVPHTLVIDPKGIVRWEGSPDELTEEVLKDIIKKYKK